MQEWLRSCDSPPLWLTSTTGFGKSVIAAFVTKFLEEQYPSSPVIFFPFRCDRYVTALSSVYHLVQTVLFHVCTKSGSTRELVKAAWKANIAASAEYPTSETLRNVFLVPAMKSFATTMAEKPLFLILDGLNELSRDEIDQLSEILEALIMMSGSPSSLPIRILITSQFLPPIEKAQVKRVRLESRHNSDTIEVYIQSQLTDSIIQWFRNSDQDPIEFFSKRHNGMFQWVATILKQLAVEEKTGLIADNGFVEILESRPEAIDKLYTGILIRTISQHFWEPWKRQWIKRILLWTVFAKRTLTLHELEEAISLSFRVESNNSATTKIIDMERTLIKCGAFLQVVDSEKGGAKTVSLVHDTFRDFIISEAISEETREISSLFVKSHEGALALTSACVLYLTDANIDVDPKLLLPSVRRAALSRQFPFFSYATLYWSEHLSEVQIERNQYPWFWSAFRGFFGRQNLKKWLHNVMAYSFDGRFGCLYDQHGMAISPALLRSVKWLQDLDPEDWPWSVNSEEGPSYASAVTEWIATIAAEVWLEQDTKVFNGPLRCYQIAKELFSHYGTPKMVDGTRKEVVERLAHLGAKSSQIDLRGRRNIGCALQFNNQDDQELARNYFLSTLESGQGSDKVVSMLYLSVIAMDVADLSGYTQDFDLAVQYATSIKDIKDSEPYLCYESYWVAMSALLKRHYRLQLDNASQSTADLLEAIKLGRQAFRELSQLGCSPDVCDVQSQTEEVMKDILSRLDQSDYHFISSLAPSLAIALSIYIRQMKKGHDDPICRELNSLVAFCEQAFKTWPKDYPFIDDNAIALGNLYLRESDTESSKDGLDKGIALLVKAAERLSKEADSSRFSGALFELGWAWRKKFAFDNAKETLSKAIEYYRQAITTTNSRHEVVLANRKFDLASALKLRREEGDREQAILYLQEATQCSELDANSSARFFNALGNILFERDADGDLGEAINSYLKAVTSTSETHAWAATYAHNLANALKRRHLRNEDSSQHSPDSRTTSDLDDSITYYRKALELVTQNNSLLPDYCINLCDALIKRDSHGDIDEAVGTYKKIIDRMQHIDGEVERVFKLNMNLGKILVKAGSSEKGEAVNLRLDDHVYQKRLADEFLTLKGPENLEWAIFCLKRAYEIEPNNASYAAELGRRILDRDGLEAHSEAILYYRKATELEPTEPSYFHGLVIALSESSVHSDEAIAIARQWVERVDESNLWSAWFRSALCDLLRGYRALSYGSSPTDWIPFGLLDPESASAIKIMTEHFAGYLFCENVPAAGVDESIQWGESAYRLFSEAQNHAGMAEVQPSLAYALMSRHARTGSFDDLDKVYALLMDSLGYQDVEFSGHESFRFIVAAICALRAFHIKGSIDESRRWLSEEGRIRHSLESVKYPPSYLDEDLKNLDVFKAWMEAVIRKAESRLGPL